MSQYDDNAQFNPPNIYQLTREEYEETLRDQLNNEDPKDRLWVQNEEIIERFLHVAYDDFDINEEMMVEFECQEVVDYLLTFLDRDRVRSFIKLSMHLRPTHPITVLANSYQIPKRHIPEIINNLIEIYERNHMGHHAHTARQASRLLLPYHQITDRP